MKRLRGKLALAVVAAGALAIGIVTVAVAGGGHTLRERLTGYQEVPALALDPVIRKQNVHCSRFTCGRAAEFICRSPRDHRLTDH